MSAGCSANVVYSGIVSKEARTADLLLGAALLVSHSQPTSNTQDQ